MDEKNEVKTREKNTSSDKGQNKMIMGVLVYLSFLVLIPFFVSKNDPFVKFHIKQGLVLFAIEIVIYLLASMFWSFWMIIQVLNLAMVVLSILGIINVVQAKEKELPLVGQFSKYFTF